MHVASIWAVRQISNSVFRGSIYFDQQVTLVKFDCPNGDLMEQQARMSPWANTLRGLFGFFSTSWYETCHIFMFGDQNY